MDDAAVPVMIVDDQLPFRLAARAVVGATSGFAVVAEAESGARAIELAESSRPELVLMDINMPGLDGIETTRRLLDRDASVLVVLVSTYAVADLPAGARRCGAGAYVHKEELTPAVLRELWANGGDDTWRLPGG
ncbi:MAG TPA: response regulator transcription factor [Acidimicrobiales bacterium]|nr:response regulator transcription factor [Acidimicrobiales bacterium]